MPTTSPPHARQTLRAPAGAEPPATLDQRSWRPHATNRPRQPHKSSQRPSSAAQGAPTLQLPRRPSDDLAHPPRHTKQWPRGPLLAGPTLARPQTLPHSSPDLGSRHLAPPSPPYPAPWHSLLTSALTRELCVWRCDLAARRPGRPLGVRAPRPDWPTARQEGGWAAAVPSSRRRSGCPQGGLLRSALDLAAASLSNSLHPAQPRAGAAPRGAESRRRWDRVLAAHPAGSAWCPRVNAIPSAQEERAGGRRAGGEGEREREEKSSRAAWLR